MRAGHTPGPLRLSSVQRWALKEILLGAHGIFDRKHNRTRASLFRKGLLTAPAGGTLTLVGRVTADGILRDEIKRRAAFAKAPGSAV